MQQETAISRLKKQETGVIIIGEWQGHAVWYRVRPNAVRMPLLQQNMKHDRLFDISEYGEIIDSGWGNPPQ